MVDKDFVFVRYPGYETPSLVLNDFGFDSFDDLIKYIKNRDGGFKPIHCENKWADTAQNMHWNTRWGDYKACYIHVKGDLYIYNSYTLHEEDISAYSLFIGPQINQRKLKRKLIKS